MAAVTFVPFVVFFSFPWIFVLANQDIQEVTVKPGEDVTLQCQVHESRINSQLLWRSGNPGSRKAVFVCREKHSYEEYQDPSFRGRVELRDPEIKNGDFSVILKNVTINDTGTYECDYSFIHICIGYRPDPISTIKLTVTDSESKAKAGDDVTLQCQGPRDNITELEWSSLDPKSAGYVFFFSRDDRSHKSLQLPSFRGRVKLRDPEMKDGDASVVLKNVTTNDSGTYECRVSAGSSGQREIVRNFIITLTVTDPRLKAKAGDDVTLQCQGPRDNITELEWSSLDLKSAGYVFFFSRDNRSHKSLQLPSFRGRVELRDPEMKDGDTSVVLKNVTTNDTGTYECRVSSDSTSEGDTPDPISTIKLTVTDPDPDPADSTSEGDTPDPISIITLTVTDPVTAKPGQDVPLQCQGPRGASITLIEWSRPDLKSDQYVFLFRDDHPNENYLLPSFRGRVELRDPEMKDGDASVVLKSVNTNDSGTYECRVSADSTSEGDTPDPISIIKLTVTDPDPGLTEGHKEGGNKEGGNKEGGNKEGGNKNGHLGLSASLTVTGCIMIFFGLFMFRKYKRLKKNSEKPAADEADKLKH